MAGIRAAHCVAAIHRVKHGAINDLSGEAAITNTDILMVPSRGQPDFKTKLRENRANDATERGNLPRGDPAGAKHTRGNRSGGADYYPRERQSSQFLAALRLGLDWTRPESR